MATRMMLFKFSQTWKTKMSTIHTFSLSTKKLYMLLIMKDLTTSVGWTFCVARPARRVAPVRYED